MGDVISLNQYRKRREKAARSSQASENPVRYRRTKAEGTAAPGNAKGPKPEAEPIDREPPNEPPKSG